MNKHTKRRKRHRANNATKFGKSSVRSHSRKGGRTGMIQARRTPAKSFGYSSSKPNPDGPKNMDLG